MARRKIEDRKKLIELHVQLHAEGKLSLRQIADLTGVTHSTVRRDIARWHADVVRELEQSLEHSDELCSSSQPECSTRKGRE